MDPLLCHLRQIMRVNRFIRVLTCDVFSKPPCGGFLVCCAWVQGCCCVAHPPVPIISISGKFGVPPCGVIGGSGLSTLSPCSIIRRITRAFLRFALLDMSHLRRIRCRRLSTSSAHVFLVWPLHDALCASLSSTINSIARQWSENKGDRAAQDWHPVILKSPYALFLHPFVHPVSSSDLAFGHKSCAARFEWCLWGT